MSGPAGGDRTAWAAVSSPQAGRAAVTLEVLYFDGCPSHDRLLPILRELAAEHAVELDQRRIETVEEAERARFLGSPTVRVDGVDVEPGAQERVDFGLKCRLYPSSDGRMGGVPPRDWIARALSEAPAR